MLNGIQRRLRDFRPVTFAAVSDAFKPEVTIRFKKDVSGWVNRDRKIRFHFNAGRTYMVDRETAVQMIVKGYATGELPRQVSDDERADIRSAMSTISLGGDDG